MLEYPCNFFSLCMFCKTMCFEPLFLLPHSSVELVIFCKQHKLYGEQPSSIGRELSSSSSAAIPPCLCRKMQWKLQQDLIVQSGHSEDRFKYAAYHTIVALALHCWLIQQWCIWKNTSAVRQAHLGEVSDHFSIGRSHSIFPVVHLVVPGLDSIFVWCLVGSHEQILSAFTSWRRQREALVSL